MNTTKMKIAAMRHESDLLLNWVAQAAPPTLPSLGPEDARNEYRRLTAILDVKPPVVGHVSNQTIPAPCGAMRIRIYHPPKVAALKPEALTSGASGLPGIVFFHGGGCVIGDLETHDALCRTLCSDVSAFVISIDYRLAPEHLFPAAVEDAVASLKWVSANANEIGIDQARIAVVGDSAGANLAAVALNECSNSLVQSVRAQVLIYPALDMRARLPSRKQFADLFPIPAEVLDWFLDHYFGAAWPIDDPRAIPLLYPDYSNLPAALIISGGADPLRDEAAEYAKMLAAANVPVTYECCEGTIHGFMTMGRILRTAYRHSRSLIADFLVEQLAERIPRTL